MIANLETRARTFEEEVAEGIRMARGWPGYSNINGDTYPINIRIDPETRDKVLNYLSRYQNHYGNLHPAELSPEIDSNGMSGILIEPTEEQAMNLARAVDKAHSGVRGHKPLRYIKNLYVSPCTGHLH